MGRKKKPIHKFNGGRGATLCHTCRVIITEGLTEDLYCEKHGGKPQWKYKLVRESDGLTKYAGKIEWIEWCDEYGTGKASHDEPKVGYSLIIDRSIMTWKWLTTPITRILDNQEKYIKFKTENSIYELFIN